MPGRAAGWIVAAALFLCASDARAAPLAAVSSGADGPAPQAEIPAELTPEQVDGLLARLTDAEIRQLLRDELERRAEAAVPEPAGIDRLAALEARLAQMAETIRERLVLWSGDIANLHERAPQVAQALARAGAGVGGMTAAALMLVVAGVAAAMAVIGATRRWRRWLAEAGEAGYWDRVVRTIALLVLELLPILAFVAATRAVAPLVEGWLGPLWGQVWIYHAGVSWSWGFIVASRRAFAPDAPAIRIAPLDDRMAMQVHALLRRSAMIGAGGWLVAGLFYNLGLGFPPALTTVALAGTAVAALLGVALARHASEVREAVARVVGGPSAGALPRILVPAAPGLMAAYLLVAWAWWVAHWIETGTHRLHGPLGTLLLFFVLPILDRLGAEIVRSTVRRGTASAERIRAALHGCWRILLGIGAVYAVVRLWGLDLWDLARGEDAPGWAATAFDIGVTLLVGRLLWRLIRAGLHTEPRLSAGGEDEAAMAGTRLDTLVPLFRNALLGVLGIVVVMIVLSSLGLDIAPLIASAGIVGIAIGFGAQTLVRDVFSGVFFLVDDAFRVGEYIELGPDLRGEVEAISIRSLQLRHHRGPVITIPFGELKQITNHNRDWVIYKMQFRMEPETDPEVFRKLVKRVGQELLAHPEHGPKFIEPLKSQGVYFVDEDSAPVMRVKFKCRPRAQFVLRREIYHALRAAFAAAGLGIARRKVEVVGPGGVAGATASEPSAAAAAE